MSPIHDDSLDYSSKRASPIIEVAAKALAAQQGIEWDSLPETDAGARRYRSPDCCNRLDCKDDIRAAVSAVLNALTMP